MHTPHEAYSQKCPPHAKPFIGLLSISRCYWENSTQWKLDQLKTCKTEEKDNPTVNDATLHIYVYNQKYWTKFTDKQTQYPNKHQLWISPLNVEKIKAFQRLLVCEEYVRRQNKNEPKRQLFQRTEFHCQICFLSQYNGRTCAAIWPTQKLN